MVRKDHVVGAPLPQQCEKGRQAPGLVEIGTFVAKATVDLRERGCAQAPDPVRDIETDEHRVAIEAQ